jgi:hypothetical protein
VNKITDYNPVVEVLTKVELIKIKKTRTFAETVVAIDGSKGVTGRLVDGDYLNTGEVNPIRGFDAFVGDNVYPEMGQRVGGTNNFVDADSVFVDIIGSNNNVSDSRQVSLINSDSNAVYSSDKVSMVNTSGSVVNYGSQNISLVNSSGIIVGANVRNVSVVNSSGVTVDTSNTIVKSNVFEVEGRITEGGVKVYNARGSQTGVAAPTITIYSPNTIGNISWSYSSAGNYVGTLTGAFPSDRTTCLVTNGYSAGNVGYVTMNRLTDNTVSLRTFDTAGTPADDILASASIKIETE